MSDVNGSELPSAKNSHDEKNDTDKILRDLPEHYFELMTSGSKLAKQGNFSEATQKFEAAQKEATRILQSLFELPKNSQATKWQVLTALWAFKIIKSVFYWLLANSETVKNTTEQKNLLLAAMGAQQVGRGLISSFKSLEGILTGKNRELLFLLAEAIQNYEDRQKILEKNLKDQGIDISQLFQGKMKIKGEKHR
jgi:hypothetical protein